MVKWLDRRISAPAPFMCLCLSEKEYRQAMRYLRVDAVPPWLNKNANATAHHVVSDKGPATVVCLGDYSNQNDIEIFGILIHEAVHVWQEWCIYYGEQNPGQEQEAYAIQSLSQTLITEFIERRPK